MKVLFSAVHFGTFRNFESVVEGLAERGHEVVLLLDEPEELGGRELVEGLCDRFEHVTWRWAPAYDGEAWFRLARRLRQSLDYLRFMSPRYAPFPKLASRAAERVPRLLGWLLRVPGVNTAAGRRMIARGLAALDRSMPRSAAMDAFLGDMCPDVALFASVTNPRTPQLDHLRSARALRIPTGVCVYSWDHLSSKALIRLVPDRVLVWNDTQKREAIELHGMPADRIVTTGAQVYDQWFGRPPGRTPEAFKAAAGLPAGRPMLTYVCSALTPDPRESRFVRQWVEAVRRSSRRDLREAGILIRPHPERRAEWDGVDWADVGPLVITGRNPVSQSAKSDYYDALCASDAVIGTVTSAFLEAAIAGRPVLTITPPEFKVHQEGMLHFRYLLEVEDGLLSVARSLAEHVSQLEAILGGDRAWVDRQQRFLRAFVRPAGLDVPATPVFLDAVEDLARLEPLPAPTLEPAWQQALARRLAALSERQPLRAFLQDAREAGEQRRRNETVRRHRRMKRRQRLAGRVTQVRRLFTSSEYRRDFVARRLGGWFR